MKKLQTLFFVSILITLFAPFAFGESRIFEQTTKNLDALIFMRDELNTKYEDYVNAQGEISQIIEDKLQPLNIKINTLKEQMDVLDENIRREEINLSHAQQLTKTLQLEISELHDKMEVKEAESGYARETLDKFLRLAYAQNMLYTDWKTGEVSPLKFALLNSKISDIEKQQTYLAVLQSVSANLIENLRAKQMEYAVLEKNLFAKRGELVLLQEAILQRKGDLEVSRDARKRLLAQTRGEERAYEKLVEESRKQQAEALLQIEELKENLGVIDAKLKTLGKDLGEGEFQELLKEQSIAGLNGVSFPKHIPRLIWPANPSRGITAQYLDPDYEKVFYMKHYAIDFRLPQGSKVKAAGPGVVFKTRDNGYGYSYIMLAHPNGLATVYGHISKIEVEEGDIVKAGDEIGLSGGTPGTLGAGYITTGPHLHFEVLDGGEHQNPLDYLPLEPLPLKDIPEKYLEEAEGL